MENPAPVENLTLNEATAAHVQTHTAGAAVLPAEHDRSQQLAKALRACPRA